MAHGPYLVTSRFTEYGVAATRIEGRLRKS